MALIKCPECSTEVSEKADVCLKCGYSLAKARKSKETANGCIGLAVILVIAFLAFKACGSGDSSISEQPKKELSREEKIKDQFSAWTGSHKNLEKVIKAAMNDPDSYKSIEGKYIDQGDYVLIIQEYTGKNAYGGTMRGIVKAKADINGNILEIISSD